MESPHTRSLPPFSPPAPPGLSSVQSDDVTSDSLPGQPQGCELLIRGLSHDHCSAAINHLDALVKDICQANPTLFPVIVTASKTKQQNDNYAYIRLDPNACHYDQPRPDLLAQYVDLLCARGVRVVWSPLSGIDKARMVDFQHPSTIPLSPTWLDSLISAVTARGIAVIHGTVWQQRATLLISNESVIPDLIGSPIVVSDRTYHAVPRRCIPPVYAFEVIVSGCAGWDSIQGTFDKGLRRSHGPRFIGSRMADNNEAYCFVMRDWASTYELLCDPSDLVTSLGIGVRTQRSR